GGRLVECQHVWKRHLPQVVIADEQRLQCHGQVMALAGRQRREAGVRRFRRDVTLVGVASEIWKEHHGGRILEQNATAILELGAEDVLEEHPAMLLEITTA